MIKRTGKGQKLTIEVPVEKIRDLFVGAFELGSDYWLKGAALESINGRLKGGPWYNDPAIYDFGRDPRIVVRWIDESPEEAYVTKTITMGDIMKGLEVMVAKYPIHFGAVLANQDDAETADVFMQCVVLGEVRFG